MKMTGNYFCKIDEIFMRNAAENASGWDGYEDAVEERMSQIHTGKFSLMKLIEVQDLSILKQVNFMIGLDNTNNRRK